MPLKTHGNLFLKGQDDTMKQVVLLCDGMADMPCDSLGGKTPMEAAHKPAMDGPDG